jgi:hypothetical protein
MIAELRLSIVQSAEQTERINPHVTGSTQWNRGVIHSRTGVEP